MNDHFHSNFMKQIQINLKDIFHILSFKRKENCIDIVLKIIQSSEIRKIFNRGKIIVKDICEIRAEGFHQNSKLIIFLDIKEAFQYRITSNMNHFHPILEFMIPIEGQPKEDIK